MMHMYTAKRAVCMRTVVGGLAPSTIAKTSSLFTTQQLEAQMNRSSMFLSIHKRCGGVNNSQAFEAFRAAQVFRFGRILVSERSHRLDEESYAGVVTFAPLQQIASAYHAIANLSHVDQVAHARRSWVQYAQRFEPARLFAKAGIYDMLDRLLLQKESMLINTTRTTRGNASASRGTT